MGIIKRSVTYIRPKSNINSLTLEPYLIHIWPGLMNTVLKLGSLTAFSQGNPPSKHHLPEEYVLLEIHERWAKIQNDIFSFPCCPATKDARISARQVKVFYHFKTPIKVFNLRKRNNHKVRSYKIQKVSVECRIFKNVKEKRNKYMLR